jgi:hypothetical protein
MFSLLIPHALAFPAVEEPLANGRMDWTSLELISNGTGTPPGGSIGSMEAMEGEARAQLGPRILELSRHIRISATQLAGDLLDAANRVADRLDENLSLWEVVHARYYTSGRVEIEGILPVHAWLRPALVTMAHGKERTGPATGPITGLMVDARGFKVLPAIAPILLDPSGTPVYGIAMVTEAAISQHPPVIYITDPADPAGVQKVGNTPILARATGVVEGANLRLDAEDSSRIREEAEKSPFLIHGAVVVVVDKE